MNHLLWSGLLHKVIWNSAATAGVCHTSSGKAARVLQPWIPVSGHLGIQRFLSFCFLCFFFLFVFFLTDECSSNQLDQQGMYSLKEGNRAESLNRAVKGKNKEKTDE